MKRIDKFGVLKKDFNKKFVKPRYVDDLDLGLFWGWIIENFEPKSQPLDCRVIKKNAEGLLPCPFCGGEPFVNKKDASLEVLCPKCLINGFVGIEKQNIIEAWNKRI